MASLTKSTMRLGKPSAYAVDGSGRDSYINMDNGGLYKPYEPAGAPDIGTFGVFNSRKQNNSGFATIQCKRQQYVSNGSGRDAYICRGNGGFYPPEQIAEYQNTYVSNLRSYPRPTTPLQYCRPHSSYQARLRSTVSSSKKPDVYMMSQSFYIKDQKTFVENYKVRISQEKSVERLAKPKRLQPKFPLRTGSSSQVNSSFSTVNRTITHLD
eukprot:403356709